MSLQADLQALIAAQVAGETVILADQNAPRPVLPYWTIRVGTVRRLGTEHYSQGVDAQAQQTVAGVREATVQVQRYGADSVQKVNDLRDVLQLTTVREAWQLKKLACFNAGDVLNVPFKLDNAQLEPRASVDLFVRFGASLKDSVGVIATVDVNTEYVTNQGTNLDETNVDLAETVTVVL